MSDPYKIGGGFAFMEAPFAAHPNDEKRALETLMLMHEAGLTWDAAKPLFEAYVNAKFAPAYVAEQMTRVRVRFKPWL